MSAGISIREFARRDGCNDKLVRRAIEKGKLQAFPDGTLDPQLIGSGWRQTNRRAEVAADTVRTPSEVSARVSAVAQMSAPKPDDDGSIDPDELAGFLKNLLAGRYATRGEAERIKENGLAGLKVLELQQKAGELIDLQTAEAVMFDTFRAYRDSWINWPSKIGPLLAADLGLEADAVVGVLTEHVHQHLADLGEPEIEFNQPD